MSYSSESARRRTIFFETPEAGTTRRQPLASSASVSASEKVQVRVDAEPLRGQYLARANPFK